jgi:hypothetical protein
MDALIRPRAPSKRWSWLVLVLALLLPEVSLRAQPAITLPSATPSTASMKSFVIIFRQSPRPLTDIDKQRRTEETVVWARHRNGAGHKLDPHILAPEIAHRRPENFAGAPTGEWPITALLFLEAEDLSAAAQVAESHPAIRYGSAVEVRPWTRPVPVAETGSSAEPAVALPSATRSTAAMKPFVMIFRQGPRPLTDTDQRRRAEEIRAWARRQNAAGHNLDPHTLAPESAHRGLESSSATPADAWPITALLFLEAYDLAEAAQVAGSHPGPHYGVDVEVRPWLRPVPVADR